MRVYITLTATAWTNSLYVYHSALPQYSEGKCILLVTNEINQCYFLGFGHNAAREYWHNRGNIYWPQIRNDRRNFVGLFFHIFMESFVHSLNRYHFWKDIELISAACEWLCIWDLTEAHGFLCIFGVSQSTHTNQQLLNCKKWNLPHCCGRSSPMKTFLHNSFTIMTKVYDIFIRYCLYCQFYFPSPFDACLMNSGHFARCLSFSVFLRSHRIDRIFRLLGQLAQTQLLHHLGMFHYVTSTCSPSRMRSWMMKKILLHVAASLCMPFFTSP